MSTTPTGPRTSSGPYFESTGPFFVSADDVQTHPVLEEVVRMTSQEVQESGIRTLLQAGADKIEDDFFEPLEPKSGPSKIEEYAREKFIKPGEKHRAATVNLAKNRDKYLARGNREYRELAADRQALIDDHLKEFSRLDATGRAIIQGERTARHMGGVFFENMVKGILEKGLTKDGLTESFVDSLKEAGWSGLKHTIVGFLPTRIKQGITAAELGYGAIGSGLEKIVDRTFKIGTDILIDSGTHALGRGAAIYIGVGALGAGTGIIVSVVANHCVRKGIEKVRDLIDERWQAAQKNNPGSLNDALQQFSDELTLSWSGSDKMRQDPLNTPQPGPSSGISSGPGSGSSSASGPGSGTSSGAHASSASKEQEEKKAHQADSRGTTSGKPMSASKTGDAAAGGTQSHSKSKKHDVLKKTKIFEKDKARQLWSSIMRAPPPPFRNPMWDNAYCAVNIGKPLSDGHAVALSPIEQVLRLNRELARDESEFPDKLYAKYKKEVEKGDGYVERYITWLESENAKSKDNQKGYRESRYPELEKKRISEQHVRLRQEHIDKLKAALKTQEEADSPFIAIAITAIEPLQSKDDKEHGKPVASTVPTAGGPLPPPSPQPPAGPSQKAEPPPGTPPSGGPKPAAGPGQPPKPGPGPGPAPQGSQPGPGAGPQSAADPKTAPKSQPEQAQGAKETGPQASPGPQPSSAAPKQSSASEPPSDVPPFVEEEEYKFMHEQELYQQIYNHIRHQHTSSLVREMRSLSRLLRHDDPSEISRPIGAFISGAAEKIDQLLGTEQEIDAKLAEAGLEDTLSSKKTSWRGTWKGIALSHGLDHTTDALIDYFKGRSKYKSFGEAVKDVTWNTAKDTASQCVQEVAFSALQSGLSEISPVLGDALPIGMDLYGDICQLRALEKEIFNAKSIREGFDIFLDRGVDFALDKGTRYIVKYASPGYGFLLAGPASKVVREFAGEKIKEEGRKVMDKVEAVGKQVLGNVAQTVEGMKNAGAGIVNGAAEAARVMGPAIAVTRVIFSAAQQKNNSQAEQKSGSSTSSAPEPTVFRTISALGSMFGSSSRAQTAKEESSKESNPTAQESNLKDEYFQKLDLDKLSSYEIRNLFVESDDPIIIQEHKRRFALIPIDKVVRAVEQYSISGRYLLSLLSDEHVRRLPLSKLSRYQIEDLLDEKHGEVENKRRLMLIPVEEVVRAIENNLISSFYLLGLLSDAHVSKLNLSKLSRVQLENLNEILSATQQKPSSEAEQKSASSSPEVPNFSKLGPLQIQDLFQERHGLLRNKKLLASIPIHEVVKAVEEHRILSSYLLGLLSDEHIKRIRFSMLTNNQIVNLFDKDFGLLRNKRIFSLISDDDIVRAIEDRCLNDSYCFLGLLTDVQIRRLRLSRFGPNLVENFFHKHRGTIENKRRLALFPTDDVLSAIEGHVFPDSYMFDLLSDDHWKRLPFSRLASQMNKLFPPSADPQDIAEHKRRLALIPQAELQAAIKEGLFDDDYLKKLL